MPGEDLDELQRNPPPWLVELRRSGSTRATSSPPGCGVQRELARGGITEALTMPRRSPTSSPTHRLALVSERETYLEVRREERRLKELRADTPQAAPGAHNTTFGSAPDDLDLGYRTTTESGCGQGFGGRQPGGTEGGIKPPRRRR